MLYRTLATLGCAVIVLLHNPIAAPAHPMPGTTIRLDVHETTIDAELSIPTGNLAEASGVDVDLRTQLSEADRAGLANYLHGHLRPTTPDGIRWTVLISDMRLDLSGQSATGSYKDLLVHATLTPPPGADMRRFVLSYDAVIHKVPTHIAIVSVRQDWRAGRVDATRDAREIGILRMNPDSMTVPPLAIDLTDTGIWRSFTGMVLLGIHHILEGTDHLLFLLTLLFPAVLLAKSGRWHPEPRPRRA
ncbi:HupE/UreJ family protein, partial [Nocardia sp. JMUB6875]|uniref:HupE/UreJ family protein n=1 Tax=Nocardia sp. JMUB6875 TaxID=3158170 RepID=UPI0034E8E59B